MLPISDGHIWYVCLMSSFVFDSWVLPFSISIQIESLNWNFQRLWPILNKLIFRDRRRSRSPTADDRNDRYIDRYDDYKKDRYDKDRYNSKDDKYNDKDRYDDKKDRYEKNDRRYDKEDRYKEDKYKEDKYREDKYSRSDKEKHNRKSKHKDEERTKDKRRWK